MFAVPLRSVSFGCYQCKAGAYVFSPDGERKMRIIIILLTALAPFAVSAATIESREFPETMTVNKKKLVLNGVALRTKKKMGMYFKVYVAGLYVTEKSKEAEKLIAPGDKVLEMVFLRAVDKEALTEAFDDHFAKNCRAKCDSEAASFKKFNELMVDQKDSGRMKLIFDKAGVTVESTGRESKSGRIEGAAFAENLMAVFIGKDPPTEEVKKGLLGN
jgi:hypothetical protein